MPDVINKINGVTSTKELTEIESDIVVALSGMQLRADYEGLEELYGSYIRMVERVLFSDDVRSRAQSDLEILTHAADINHLHATYGDAYEAAKSTNKPTEQNMGPVRKFYRNAIHGDLMNF